MAAKRGAADCEVIGDLRQGYAAIIAILVPAGLICINEPAGAKSRPGHPSPMYGS
jgi:hypothetical protein